MRLPHQKPLYNWEPEVEWPESACTASHVDLPTAGHPPGRPVPLCQSGEAGPGHSGRRVQDLPVSPDVQPPAGRSGGVYITLRYITLHYVTLLYITLLITLRYIILRYITLLYVTLRYITFPYITLHYITSH